MPANKGSSAIIVTFGLDGPLGAELESALNQQHHMVFTEPFVSGIACLRRIERLGADMAFCVADRDRYMQLLDEVVKKKPDFPVVIVSRTPEVSEWLDAIEAGASDYCAAPFESNHMKWILESNLKTRVQAPARYRTAAR